MADDGGRANGELTMRVPAMPADANAAGDVFGGWVIAQMDLSAGIRASERAKGRVVTAAINALSFRRPVKIGDVLELYTAIAKVGRTSMVLTVEAWAQRYMTHEKVKVTDASFVMVAVDAEGAPRPVPPEDAPT
jgi:acyl-CoA thioesterase YciA